MEKRPDLLENRVFTKEEEKLMQEIKAERALEKEK